jgi:hypothetical protein
MTGAPALHLEPADREAAGGDEERDDAGRDRDHSEFQKLLPEVCR